MKKARNNPGFVPRIIIYTICFISFYPMLPGCESTVNDNDDPTGCSKSANLSYPHNDTSLHSPVVDFTWFEPTCGADYYKLVIYRTNFYDTIITPSTAVSRSLPVSYRYYWKVTSYKDSPSKDSAESAVYNFYSIP